MTGGTAASAFGARQCRVVGISFILGGLALLAVATVAWFSAVTAPIVYDNVQDSSGESLSSPEYRGGLVFGCPTPVPGDPIGQDFEPACEEPLTVRRLAAAALTIPGVVFLVAGTVFLRARRLQHNPSRSRPRVPEEDTSISRAAESLVGKGATGGDSGDA